MKNYVIINENNHVVAMCNGFRIGMEGCTTVEVDDALDQNLIDGYILEDDKIVFSDERYAARQHENKQWDLRNKRDEVCFSVVNRGDVWYDMYVTTDERKQEFQEWYQAWLDVTDTMVEPETPEWIK